MSQRLNAAPAGEAPSTPDHDDDAASVARLLRIAEGPPPTADALRLASGHSVRVDERDANRISVHAPDGRLQIALRFTADGPVLELDAATLELRATRDVHVECERFDVRARRAVTIASEADVAIDAAEHVDVHGGKILLNC
jgi:hypothetical protein